MTTATQARLLVPRTGRMRRMGPKLPYTLTWRTIACRRRVTFGQHFVEKMMSCGLRHCAVMS